MSTVLITGASRGLGLEFARQYRADGWRVIACCRTPETASALSQLGVEVQALDVADPASIAELGRRLDGQAIDLLINNAGIYGHADHQVFGAVDAASFLEAQQTNVFAPLAMTQTLQPNLSLADKAVVAIVSSRMGAISENTSGGEMIYRVSKASVNMVGVGMANALAPQGIAVVLLHPGWVRTDMGGPNGMIDAPESIQGMRAMIAQTSVASTGRFVDYQGKELPW